MTMCLAMVCVMLSVPMTNACRMGLTVDKWSPPVLSGKVGCGSQTDLLSVPRTCVKVAQLHVSLVCALSVLLHFLLFLFLSFLGFVHTV